MVEQPLSLSLAELSDRFDSVKTTATLTCAGNRRVEHNAVNQVGGVQWQSGAIGNATWGGVKLSDVLKAARLKSDAKHVWFEGLDEIERDAGTIPFGGSIPLTKAFEDTDAAPGAMLATAMNGAALTSDHGAPLRSLVPGYIGARSVKWLGRIVVSDRPSPNHYLAHAYKLVQATTDLSWDEAGPLYRYPVNSVICTPSPGTRLNSGTVVVQGYSLPGGESDSVISKVEISSDGGTSWTAARFRESPQPFCWTLWTASVSVKQSTQSLIVRATDSYGRQQPQFCLWNAKGYFFNGWHSVPVAGQ